MNRDQFLRKHAGYSSCRERIQSQAIERLATGAAEQYPRPSPAPSRPTDEGIPNPDRDTIPGEAP